MLIEVELYEKPNITSSWISFAVIQGYNSSFPDSFFVLPSAAAIVFDVLKNMKLPEKK